MVQIGEKEQGCKMIEGVDKQYPETDQSTLQRAKFESKKYECSKPKT
jgi:TolA-binding protein